MMPRTAFSHPAELHPHDLLWGMTPEQLPEEAPAWAKDCLAQGHPVVVRRDTSREGLVAVGLRGQERGDRFPGWLPPSSIERRVRPEHIQSLAGAGDAVATALADLADIFAGEVWGVTGSFAFEELTGLKVTRPSSDLDVLLRWPSFISPDRAAELSAQIARLPVRVDVQVDSGCGGFALREWSENRGKVLLKTGQGAVLTGNPWLMGGVT